ncbi:unnamed protein product, partial [Ostreobium quekettii]|eukprot:evm.model.scf_1243.5 EVM.evm.TU.scf_1243.5   scf_1243:41629-42488(+)
MAPAVATRAEHDRLRAELLKAEKALTHQRDEVARQRRLLPWVRLEKDYALQDADGSPVLLSGLFKDGKQDLVVYHMMFDPEWDGACPLCCFWTEGYDTNAPFFEDKFNFAVVAKAPHDRLKALMALKGWTLPMYSSAGSDFNADMRVQDTFMISGGTKVPLTQVSGVSVFRKEGDVVYHTYTTKDRGVEVFTP